MPQPGQSATTLSPATRHTLFHAVHTLSLSPMPNGPRSASQSRARVEGNPGLAPGVTPGSSCSHSEEQQSRRLVWFRPILEPWPRCHYALHMKSTTTDQVFHRSHAFLRLSWHLSPSRCRTIENPKRNKRNVPLVDWATRAFASVLKRVRAYSSRRGRRQYQAAHRRSDPPAWKLVGNGECRMGNWNGDRGRPQRS